MRRSITLGRTTAAIAVAATSLLGTTAVAADADTRDRVQTLDQLYTAAKAEGGTLTIYAGGDQPGQFDQISSAFQAQFPDIHVKVQVDLSKYHDARIDNQLARGALEPDVAYLQTVQDFGRWKREGVLLKYRPIGWEHVQPTYKDPQGYFTGLTVLAVTNVVNLDLLPGTTAPKDYSDFLDPSLKGRLAMTFPNDDDAVLYQWKLAVDTYGWDFVRQLVAQDPAFSRGTPVAAGAVAAGFAAASFGSIFPVAPIPGLNVRSQFPPHDPFQSWAQTAAIFKAAQHPAAAKLFMSWMLSAPVQQGAPFWPARDDVTPANGLAPIANYNTDPVAFKTFMTDRAGVESFRNQVELYVGQVTGPNPAVTAGPGPFFPAS